MKTLTEIQPRIREILEKSNENYREAHALAKSGIISEDLSMYLKERINMRSCLDIAKLFAEEGNIDDSALRLSEALSVLTGIYELYGNQSQCKGRHKLAEIAKEEYHQAYQECKNLLQGRN